MNMERERKKKKHKEEDYDEDDRDAIIDDMELLGDESPESFKE